MNFSQKKRKRTPAVIIIALIDVLLVVLIFLVVTTTFKTQEPAVKVSLPESEQAKAGQVSETTIMLTVAKEAPWFYLGPEPVTTDVLNKELADAVRENPEIGVVAKIDEGTPWRVIVQVHDAIKKADIKSFKAITETK